MSVGCLWCGGSGFKVNGEKCSCGVSEDISIPFCVDIPQQYQGIRFSSEMSRPELKETFGKDIENLIRVLTTSSDTRKNYLVCAPLNSGKTVFAYTVYGMLYAKGIQVPKLLDLMEVREIFHAMYYKNIELAELLSTARLIFVRIPMDLPNKFPEIISSIVERRTAHGGSTIFLYSGSKQDLINQDTFGKMKYILGDGSYKSIEVKEYGF